MKEDVHTSSCVSCLVGSVCIFLHALLCGPACWATTSLRIVSLPVGNDPDAGDNDDTIVPLGTGGPYLGLLVCSYHKLRLWCHQLLKRYPLIRFLCLLLPGGISLAKIDFCGPMYALFLRYFGDGKREDFFFLADVCKNV